MSQADRLRGQRAPGAQRVPSVQGVSGVQRALGAGRAANRIAPGVVPARAGIGNLSAIDRNHVLERRPRRVRPT